MTPYVISIAAIWLWAWINPVKRLLTHFLGDCYVIRYRDINGTEHVIRILAKDPREATLVQLIINRIANEH